MNDREARLARFLAKDDAPARDYVFEARVAFAMQKDRIVQAGMMRTLLLAAGMAGVWALLSTSTVPNDAWVMVFGAAALGGAFLLVRRQFMR